MIRRNGTYESEIREKMRGGEGKVRIEHLWKKEELKGKTRLCARLTLDPGASIGFHEHAGEEEIYAIVSGEGITVDGGTEAHVRAGDTILTGDGAGHSIQAVGAQPLVILAVILLC